MRSARRLPTSMPCPSCRQLIGVNSQKCAHCGLLKPGFFTSMPILGDLIRNQIQFSSGIMVACFALFIGAMAIDLATLMAQYPSGITREMFALFAQPSSEVLYKLGWSGSLILENGQWWRLITATYLHGSLLHIALNMWIFRRLAGQAEAEYGASRFFLIYTGAGLAGTLLSTLMGTYASVGASGAIFGLFGALGIYGWRRGGTYGRSLMFTMLWWGGLNLLLGFGARNIDNWGHLGGLIGGLLLGLLLGYNDHHPQKLWHHVAAAITLIVVVLSFTLMVSNFLALTL